MPSTLHSFYFLISAISLLFFPFYHGIRDGCELCEMDLIWLTAFWTSFWFLLRSRVGFDQLTKKKFDLRSVFWFLFCDLLSGLWVLLLSKSILILLFLVLMAMAKSDHISVKFDGSNYVLWKFPFQFFVEGEEACGVILMLLKTNQKELMLFK